MAQVVVTSGSKLRHTVQAGEHRFEADEPADAGGDDAGPNPYELLLAALGACTSMTLLIYARRKGWPLEKVEVRLTHSRIHARDCEECEQEDGYLDHVEKEITVAGPLTAQQVTRLGEIAEICPVNRTLHQTVHTVQTIRLMGDASPE